VDFRRGAEGLAATVSRFFGKTHFAFSGDVACMPVLRINHDPQRAKATDD
jgi:hypothetical protein